MFTYTVYIEQLIFSQINHRQFHQQCTPIPSHLLLHASQCEPHMWRSSPHAPTLHLTKTQRLEQKTSHLDSSDQRTDFHMSNVHCSCFLVQPSLFFLVSFSSFYAAIRP